MVKLIKKSEIEYSVHTSYITGDCDSIMTQGRL